MTEIGQDAVKGNRIYWLDNLRTFMIFLVVLLHAGIVYENSGVGALFWIVDDPSTNYLPGILNQIIDIFVMSAIFFIAGYFTPLSMENKNGWTFLKSKFKRLMIPWIIAVFTLIPLYKFIFHYSRNLPQENWTTYFHFNNGIFSQNWLWFLPVLFLLDILYLLISKVPINISKLTIKKAIWAVFFIGFIYLVCMNIFNGEGWTKTILIDFQNERLLIYFMVFLLGSLCYKLKTFESKGKNKKLYIVLSCTAWIPVILYIKLLQYSMINPGKYIFSEIVDALLIRFNLLLLLLCLLYLMINTFRYYLNKQGKISKELNKNSYGVYIIHVIVLGGIALAMLNRAIPSPIKYLVLTVSTYAACNLIVYFYRKFMRSKILIKRMEEKTMKKVMTAILAVSLLAISGCGKQENPIPHVSLHIAALQGNIDEIQKHIKAGSDLNAKDEYGSSPLIIAITFGKTEVARALIEAGADMKIKNNEGSTPLHIAAFFCRTEIVEALLDNGADKNLRNDTGSTALDIVVRPFEDVKGIYHSIGKSLKPLGLRLDYERIKMTRPKIAEMLK